MCKPYTHIVIVQITIYFVYISLGENMIKGTRATKVKVLFQGLHIAHVIFVLVYNFIICILNTSFNIAF